jgi:hypothetical protein
LLNPGFQTSLSGVWNPGFEARPRPVRIEEAAGGANSYGRAVCMYRFADTDFERSFYRDLFGDETDGENASRDVDWAVDPGDKSLQTFHLERPSRRGGEQLRLRSWDHAPWLSRFARQRSSRTFAR